MVAIGPADGSWLTRYFGGDAHSWMNLQAIYDLRQAEIANKKKIEKEVVPAAS